MTTLKLPLGLGMTVVLRVIAGARLGHLHHVGAHLDDASSYGATTAPPSEQ